MRLTRLSPDAAMGPKHVTMRPICVVAAAIMLGVRASVLFAQVPPLPTTDRSAQAMSSAPLSTAQLLAMLKAPRNAAELLENLNILSEAGLLMEPAFAKDAVLLKVFSGRAVHRQPWDGGTQDLVIEIDDARFPKMAVTLRLSRHAPDTVSETSALSRVDLRLTVASISGLDICAVRDRFGQGYASIFRPTQGIDGVSTVSSAEGQIRYLLGDHYTKTPNFIGAPARTTGFAAFYVGFPDPPREILQATGTRIFNSDAVEAIQIVLGEN
jgi:hypothetical protein